VVRVVLPVFAARRDMPLASWAAAEAVPVPPFLRVLVKDSALVGSLSAGAASAGTGLTLGAGGVGGGATNETDSAAGGPAGRRGAGSRGPGEAAAPPGPVVAAALSAAGAADPVERSSGAALLGVIVRLAESSVLAVVPRFVAFLAVASGAGWAAAGSSLASIFRPRVGRPAPELASGTRDPSGSGIAGSSSIRQRVVRRHGRRLSYSGSGARIHSSRFPYVV
jgi:hypothetical protein